jgi:hypothetical protein
MKYQDCVEWTQAPDALSGRACLSDANINPRTGLATDYLNHFNEAIMLLEMLPACPDCIDDFLSWRPMSYREHFAGSRFKGRDLAIAAYEAAEPGARESLDALAGSMTAMLEATRAALAGGLPAEAASLIAEAAAVWLKPLIARAGAVINGEAERAQPSAPQAVVDGLMRRNFS